MIKLIEPKPIAYEEFWVARVIQDLGNKKVVYNEKIFENEPTIDDILPLLQNIPKNCFVSIAHNYKLAD